ncbi:MAG: universal stress protein [Pseudomonadota bacterium]
MEKLNSLLVASDLSPRAAYALARALRLAQEQQARLHVLHVVADVVNADNWPRLAFGAPGAVERELAQEAEAALRAQLAAHPAARVHAEPHVRIGTPHFDILAQARAHSADLIVLGAHGGHYLKEWLLGTTAERVIRSGDRPVLVVKKTPRAPYRRVVAAVDFSDTSRAALQRAAQLAPHAAFTVLHAYHLWYEARLRAGGMSSDAIQELYREHEQDVRGKLEAFVRDAGLDAAKATLVAQRGYPPTVIMHEVSARRADLVAVGTQGMSAVRRMLLGSVAEHVLREARADVLTVPPRAETQPS